MSTYTPLVSLTTAASASSITLGGIPQGYTDLVVSVVFGVSSGIDIGIGFNYDTTSIYSSQRAFGYSGATAGANRSGNLSAIQPRTPANQATTLTTPWLIHIFNYSNTATNKTTLSRYGYPLNNTEFDVGVYRSTNAIQTITLDNLTGGGTTFASGTTIQVYGIMSGTPKAMGGTQVTTDGTYWYHTYLTSGTFTPTQALTVDYLVVAGGGGGGGGQSVTNNRGGGGGGAGGVRCTVGATGGGGSVESTLSLTTQTYAVTIGAGGSAGWNNTGGAGSSGSNSTFATITSTGGGGGGLSNTDTASTGGSGGGAGTGYNGKSGTSGQGYAGGNVAANLNVGGGGGGASAVGSNGAAGAGGNGGNGISTTISGAAVSYGGGGGGAGATPAGSTAGTGGTGGGGNGGYHSSSSGTGLQATSGTANRGGGGGGGAADFYSGAPANGGSGIVIVRYSV